MEELIQINDSAESVRYLKKKDKRLSKVIDLIGPITYKSNRDPYAFLIHEIIEQMLSKTAASKIYNRFEMLCGGDVTPETVSKFSLDKIKSVGTSLKKASCIQELTDACMSGNLSFSELTFLSDSEIIKQLTMIKGIGIWTAKMYLIFVLDRQDVLPYEDAAFLQGYTWLYNTSDRSPEKVKKMCKKWSPYCSIASRYIYRSLDMGLTKQFAHL